MKHAVVAIARWEHEFLLEWIMYHLLVGFTHIFIYDNGDATREQPFEELIDPLLTLLGERHRVTFIPFPGYRVQPLAYTHWINTYSVMFRDGYAAFIDIDEYVVFPNHRTLGLFCDAYQHRSEMTHFAMPWIMFGTNGHFRKPSGLLIDNFVTRSPYPGKNFKTLVRVKFLLPPLDAVYCIHNIMGEAYLTSGFVLCHQSIIPSSSLLPPPCHFPLNVDEPLLNLDVYLHHYFSRDVWTFIKKTFQDKPMGTSARRSRYSAYADMFRYQSGYSEVYDDTLSRMYGAELRARIGFLVGDSPPQTVPITNKTFFSVARFCITRPDLQVWWKFDGEVDKYKYNAFLKYVHYCEIHKEKYEKSLKRCPYL